MGRWSIAIMLGVPGAAPFLESLDTERMVDLFQRKHPEPNGLRPEFDANQSVHGFIVTIDDRGNERPRLNCPIDMLTFPTAPAYEVAVREARAAWEHWTTFLTQRGVKGIPIPRFYLVQIETG